MSRLSKKTKNIRTVLNSRHKMVVTEAIKYLQEFASKKFNESVDIAINLGIDPKKSDQVVRSATLLPNGTGKTVRVIVFAQGEQADKAKAAGADRVGFEDMAEYIKAGNIDFDVVIATPDSMRLVGQLGQILGPRGLMPNPKVGTVATNVAQAVIEAKAGQVRYRNDKNGIIHCSVGQVNFTIEKLIENIKALIVDIKRIKPVTSKGTYLKKISLSSTMGPGIELELNEICD